MEEIKEEIESTKNHNLHNRLKGYTPAQEIKMREKICLMYQQIVVEITEAPSAPQKTSVLPVITEKPQLPDDYIAYLESFRLE
jgi:hypothetical protein